MQANYVSVKRRKAIEREGNSFCRPYPEGLHGGRVMNHAGVGHIFAAFVLTAGRFLAKRRHYMFCLVMGGVESIFMPFGTILGVFTISVLMREWVKQLFTANKAPQATAALPGS